MTQATPYQSFPNSFRRDLLAGKKLVGCWSSLSSAITTEVLGLFRSATQALRDRYHG